MGMRSSFSSSGTRGWVLLIMGSSGLAAGVSFATLPNDSIDPRRHLRDRND
jgi:hypothetical protein